MLRIYEEPTLVRPSYARYFFHLINPLRWIKRRRAVTKISLPAENGESHPRHQQRSKQQTVMLKRRARSRLRIRQRERFKQPQSARGGINSPHRYRQLIPHHPVRKLVLFPYYATRAVNRNLIKTTLKALLRSDHTIEPDENVAGENHGRLRHQLNYRRWASHAKHDTSDNTSDSTLKPFRRINEVTSLFRYARHPPTIRELASMSRHMAVEWTVGCAARYLLGIDAENAVVSALRQRVPLSERNWRRVVSRYPLV